MAADQLTVLFTGVSAYAVCAGVIFAVFELRQMAEMRREQNAFAIVQTVQTQEVRRAMGRILHLPKDAPPPMINNDEEILASAFAVDSACEMWGCMVFEGIVDHQMLDRMVGGWVRGSWTRLRAWVNAERESTGNPNVGEWWEWLYCLLEADPDKGKIGGAHVNYRGVVNAKKRKLPG